MAHRALTGRSCIPLLSLLTLRLPAETPWFCLTKLLKRCSLLLAPLESKTQPWKWQCSISWKSHTDLCAWTQSGDWLEYALRTTEERWWEPSRLLKARKADKSLLAPEITVYRCVREKCWQQQGGPVYFLIFLQFRVQLRTTWEVAWAERNLGCLGSSRYCWVKRDQKWPLGFPNSWLHFVTVCNLQCTPKSVQQSMLGSYLFS